MIGYGPDISDGFDKKMDKKEEADFHPPPPPITKGNNIVLTSQSLFVVRRWPHEGICDYRGSELHYGKEDGPESFSYCTPIRTTT